MQPNPGILLWLPVSPKTGPWLTAAALLLAVAGCDLGSGPPPAPNSLAAAGGANQTATVATAVPMAPAVRVLNKKGKPMSGRQVVFAVGSGGGHISGATQVTDADGIARVGGWVLGTGAGSNTLQASVPELPPYIFTATGVAADPATITIRDGDGQTGVVGSPVTTPPSVLVKDVYGNPVGQETVDFQVTSGGGFLTGGSPATDGQGIARVGAWSLGTVPGPNSLSATSSGLAAVTFDATAQADVPSQVTALVGDGQTGTVGTDLPVKPTVLVADRYGNLLADVPVTFEVVSGGGTIADGFQNTNDSGVAIAGTWTLGTSSGTQTLAVSIPGMDPLVLSATAEAGAPAAFEAEAGTGQTATVGTEVPVAPAVMVQDQFGNPVPGVAVTFTESGAPGPASGDLPRVLTGADAMTNEEGVASLEGWTLGTVAGTYEVTATLAALGEPVVFSAVAAPDLPSALAKVQGDGQSAQIDSEVAVPPQVKVQDQYGNGVAGVEVVFAVTQGEGTLTGSSATSGVDGLVTVGSWTLGSVPGINTLTAAAEGLEPVVFSATAIPGIPANITKVVGDSQTAQVASPVPVPPQVRVTDAGGDPVSWVSVEFTVVSGGGSVTEAVAVTDADGRAAVGSWTLGTTAGAQTLAAATEGLDPVSFSAQATAGAPASMAKDGGDGQAAGVSSPVSIPPSVLVEDAFGNRVPGASVTFSVTDGGGAVTGSPATSNANGIAAVGSWTLGPAVGANELTATLSGVGSVTFGATGLASQPATLTKVVGDGQTEDVGTTLPTAPRVRVTDGGGNPVPLVSVVFSLGSGGGSITDGSATTDASGYASVGSWTLGTTTGSNTLEATVTGLPSVTFSATATAGPAASMVVSVGNNQTASVGSPVAVPPSVLILDAFGNPVPTVPVTFGVTAGGGSVSDGSTTTTAGGIATVGGWTLGPAAGANQLTATSAGLTPVAFSATGVSPGGFDLELDYQSPIDPGQQAIFEAAADRWEEVIVGDIPDFTGTLSAGACQPVAELGGIDDVKVYISVIAIDGPGGTLGRAGPCYIWNPGNAFPITGIMELDEDDVANMQANGTLEDVIIHELGHVLGIGTLWDAYDNDFLVGGGTGDPYFNGPGAIAAFDAAGGDVRTDPKVPVENTGGSGTRDAHWRETTHNAELMTGWIEASGNPNPLSAITVASLADMGYVVDMTAADPYTLFAPQGAPPAGVGAKLIFIKELPPPTPIHFDPRGGGLEP